MFLIFFQLEAQIVLKLFLLYTHIFFKHIPNQNLSWPHQLVRMFDARAGVCGLMDGHYNYTNHGNRLSMQIKTSYHNKVCNLEYNKQNNRELYICTTNVLIILINFSLSLFLHCSYFLAISEPTCSYKVCSYKKECMLNLRKKAIGNFIINNSLSLRDGYIFSVTLH